MQRTTTLIIGSIFALLVFIASGIIFFSLLLTKSLPQYNDKKNFNDVSATINIYRDEIGVPHIVASNERDAYFTLGYVHAKERLWQMEIQRLVAQGKLSEFFGEPMLDFDILFRTLNFNERSNLLVQQCSQRSLEFLNSYSSGINSFLSSHSSSLPLEFSVLDYTPKQWRPNDCFLTLLLFDFLNNHTLTKELLLSRLCQNNDNQKILALFPFQNEHPFLRTDSTSFPSFFFNTLLAFQKKFQLQQNERISSFAVTPSKHFKPAIATTYYTSTSLLSRWFILQLSFEQHHITGITIPGMPIMYSGKNDSSAWTCFPKHSASVNFYTEQNTFQQIFLRKEDIPIRNRSDVVTIEIQETQSGIMVNTVLRDDMEYTTSITQPVFMRISDENLQKKFDFYFALHTSSTLDEVNHLIEKYHFVDNILLVNEKSVRLSPHDSNAASASILTEEHSSWENLRLRSILDTLNNFGFVNYRDIQNNIESLRAKKIVPILLSSFENETQSSETIQFSLQHLRNWNYHSFTEEIAPTIFNAFYRRLLEYTLEDETGNEMFSTLIQQENMVFWMMDNIVLQNNEAWFDNIFTEKKESRDEIFRASFRAAVSDLEKYFGTEMKRWQWKHIHSYSYYHPLGEHSELFENIFLSRTETTNYPLQNRRENIFLKYLYLEPQLASAKLIVDFSSPQEMFATIFAGESGHPLSANYKNFVPLLLKNNYHKLHIFPEENDNEDSETLSPQ